MLAISKRYLFSPASSTQLRKVGSCKRGEQEATTTRSSLFFPDHPLDLLLAGIGATIAVAHRCHHIGQGLGVFAHRFRVHAAGDVGAAVADKDPDSGIISLASCTSVAILHVQPMA